MCVPGEDRALVLDTWSGFAAVCELSLPGPRRPVSSGSHDFGAPLSTSVAEGLLSDAEDPHGRLGGGPLSLGVSSCCGMCGAPPGGPPKAGVCVAAQPPPPCDTDQWLDSISHAYEGLFRGLHAEGSAAGSSQQQQQPESEHGDTGVSSSPSPEYPATLQPTAHASAQQRQEEAAALGLGLPAPLQGSVCCAAVATCGCLRLWDLK